MNTLKFRLIAQFEGLKTVRQVLNQEEYITDMARIKTILRERYNYHVTY